MKKPTPQNLPYSAPDARLYAIDIRKPILSLSDAEGSTDSYTDGGDVSDLFE